MREPSLLDATCEDFVYDLAAISPTLATQIGIDGHDGELQDFSPEYWDRVADRMRDLIADVDALNDSTDDSDDEDDFDDVDNLTAAILRDRLCMKLELHHRGELLRQLNNIASPIQEIRDSFALMPRVTEQDFDAIASRMSRIPAALAGYRESLAEAASAGDVASHRQIDAVINQCEALGESDSQLDELGLPPESKIVEEAKAAFTQMADWLSTELGPKSPHDDAVGRERYELFAELFHGRNVDLDEGYAWAQEELKRTVDKQKQIARKLYDDDSVAAAYRHLNQDERYTIHGTDNLLAWMNSVNEDVANVFPIPEGMPPVECAIDRAGSGGIFYTPPSDAEKTFIQAVVVFVVADRFMLDLMISQLLTHI